MARTLKQDEHTAKRNEILDVALQLVYAKGYGKMTIQDILEQLQISKGAFYHYFDSKASVLEALALRMVTEQVEPQLLAIVQSPQLTAIEKLQSYFDTAVQWKTAEREFMMVLVKVWYSDENALARQKMYAQMIAHVHPLFVEITRQGVAEGVFSTPYPEQASLVIISLSQTLGDAFARLLLTEETRPGQALEQAETLLAAYADAVERILGASRGSVRLMNAESLKVWFSTDGPADARSKPRLGESVVPGSLEK